MVTAGLKASHVFGFAQPTSAVISGPVPSTIPPWLRAPFWSLLPHGDPISVFPQLDDHCSQYHLSQNPSFPRRPAATALSWSSRVCVAVSGLTIPALGLSLRLIARWFHCCRFRRHPAFGQGEGLLESLSYSRPLFPCVNFRISYPVLQGIIFETLI